MLILVSDLILDGLSAQGEQKALSAPWELSDRAIVLIGKERHDYLFNYLFASQGYHAGEPSSWKEISYWRRLHPRETSMEIITTIQRSPVLACYFVNPVALYKNKVIIGVLKWLLRELFEYAIHWILWMIRKAFSKFRARPIHWIWLFDSSLAKIPLGLWKAHF